LTKNLNVRTKAIKFLRENVRGKLYDLVSAEYFLGMTPKAWATKERRDTLTFIKIKNVCASKDTINRVKRQLMERERIFADHVLDKGSISSVYKEFLQLTGKTPTTQLRNGQRT